MNGANIYNGEGNIKSYFIAVIVLFVSGYLLRNMSAMWLTGNVAKQGCSKDWQANKMGLKYRRS